MSDQDNVVTLKASAVHVLNLSEAETRSHDFH